MIHDDLTLLLKTTAAAAGAASFWHGKQTSANLNYNAEFPQAHLFLMPSQLQGGHITTQVAMCFYGKDEHEHASNLDNPATAYESLAIQADMDKLTQRFYQLVRELPDVELKDDRMERVPVLRQGAQIGTGYFVNFTLTHLAAC